VRLSADTIIDLMPKEMWGRNGELGSGRENLNHFCLSATKGEWEDLRRRLAAEGTEIVDGPVPRWGAHGVGTSIYFRDPEGNMIEVRYY
jgi:catechol 2,3-dioxygenase-like lactoylglutathione lyase family enzyme